MAPGDIWRHPGNEAGWRLFNPSVLNIELRKLISGWRLRAGRRSQEAFICLRNILFCPANLLSASVLMSLNPQLETKHQCQEQIETAKDP